MRRTTPKMDNQLKESLLSLENTLTVRKQALAKDLSELWSTVGNIAAN